MRKKQMKPKKLPLRRYRQYDLDNITNAYQAVKNGMSVNKASKQFGVPSQTLRDRVLGKIDPECISTGRAPVFSLEEEARLVKHLKKMATMGYGYTRQEVVNIATDFGKVLGKKKKGKPAFTLRWFRGFRKRWPELRVIKPRALEHLRAKACSKQNVETYFEELRKMMDKYDVTTNPHLIFNIDEKGISQNHVPPHVVAGTDFHPQAVTSGKSSTTTILGCGSAAGVAIPPFFVFAGARMREDLLEGASPGAAGCVSENGWSNSDIFRKYLAEHFLKFVPNRDNQHILLLLDGHKTHVSPDLIEWAKDQNIVLMILPAHTSHVLQPLDVGCFGPLQRIYNAECHRVIRESSSSVITKYDVCKLACKAYTKALAPENLHSAFKRTGIYPFNPEAVDENMLEPAEVFQRALSEETETNVNDTIEQVEEVEQVEQDMNSFFQDKEVNLQKVKSEHNLSKKERNTLGKIVSGKAVTESDVEDKIKSHVESQQHGKKKGKKRPSTEKVKKGKHNSKSTKYTSNTTPADSQQPGPSRINLQLSEDYTDTDDDEILESEKCCVCNQYTPDDVGNSNILNFVNWAQCDVCKHWVHLRYCTSLKAVRMGVEFRCVHCE